MNEELFKNLINSLKDLAQESKKECSAKECEEQRELSEVDNIISIKDHAHDACKKLYPTDPKYKFYRDVILAYQEFCERVEELAEED